MLDVEATVVANTRLSGAYNVVALAAPELAARVRPGQFVMVKPARGLDPLLRRPFSIFEILLEPSGAPAGVSLLNKVVGVGTRLLFEVEPGARVACLGPLGRPFEAVDPPAEAWMVAGGVGLAPFATLAGELHRRGTPSTLFYGARRAAELFSLDLFASLGVRLVLATEDGSRGAAGFITAPLGRELDAAGADRPVTLYACGPTAMMRAVADLARARRRALHVSLEPTMGCGLGGCYSCVVRVRREGAPPHFVRSCLDGPVFPAEAIVWEELSGWSSA
jgi:dihydroorotate dehydrogenase electron transfer subunit